MARLPLPPPPPPVGLRTWPDRTALLADRARALDVLRRRGLGLGRLAPLWGAGVLAAVGWGLLTLPLQGFGPYGDRMMLMMAPVLVPLGAGALAPAVVVVLRGVRRDRAVRALVDQWWRLDRAPGVDARLRAPGLVLAWLLLSFGPCALGLRAAFATAAEAGSPADVTLGMGVGVILWSTGLLGVARASGYRRATRG